MRETGCYDTFPDLEILPEDGLTVLETYETKPLDIDVSQNPFMPPYTVDGKEITMQVKAKDHVIYSKYAGTEVELEGKKYIVVKQNDILAVIK